MEDVTELEPITPEQREAVLACRFVTTNQDRICAWLWTNEAKVQETLAPILLTCDNYLRDSVEMTREWEMRCTHPEVIELVVQIMGRREHLVAR